MWYVYKKELLELFRDKKTLLFVIALPIIIFPVLFGAMGLFIVNATLEEHHKVLKYIIINGEKAPEYSQAMLYHRDFKYIPEEVVNTLLPINDFIQQDETLETRIRSFINQQHVDVVIYIPNDYRLSATKQSQWRLYFNNASQINFIQQKVNKVFDSYVKQLRTKQLDKFNITEQTFQQLQTPIQLTTISTAKQRESIGEKIGGVIPYILILLCLTGAMYPAIDLGAGEKERGTLETLLLTPTARTALVAGKFFTIFTTAITTALITVVSFVFWSYFISKMLVINEISETLTAIAITDIVYMIAMLLPVSAIFAGLVLSISIYAKSYKEAQNYMAPLTMMTVMPVIVAMLPGIELDSFWAFVPIANVALAIKEILKGTVDIMIIVYIFTSSIAFAVITLSFCVYCFKKESVLFR